MASLNDLVRRHTALTEADLEWLHLLISDWEILADLSFADLLLWLPDRDGRRYHAGAQMRPTTGPTAFADDMVGTVVRRGARPLIDRAFDEGRICREGDPEWRREIPVRVETIPVRRARSVIAVIARSTNLLTARTPSRLELTYLETAGDLAQMIAQGQFPYAVERADLDSSPRVGDGLVRLDEQGLVTYASPNGLSAYRRFGLAADLVGGHLGTMTAKLARSDAPTDEAIEVLASGRKPRETEVENDTATLRLRLIPLSPGGARTGALVLLRDVTELRRRERELLTKDATIREIHHRVKNNLQTVAALLRLQARRLDVPAGRAALEEAVRRVGSIAVVHETLAHTQDEAVAFDNVADRVMAMATEVSTAEAEARPRRRGRFGMLPAQVATPLAMVLTEVLQNALEHGLKDGPGDVTVSADRLVGRLRVVVADDGVGLPDDFDPERSGRLGLQIVRTLVTVELNGTLDVGPQPGGGTRVVIDLPLPGPQVSFPRR